MLIARDILNSDGPDIESHILEVSMSDVRVIDIFMYSCISHKKLISIPKDLDNSLSSKIFIFSYIASLLRKASRNVVIRLE